MTMEITITVPNALGRQLQHFRGHLPEWLERGLRALLAGRTMETDMDGTMFGRTEKERVLAALRSTGIVTVPKPAARSQLRVRHTPIKAGGQLASEMIIKERGRKL